VEERQEIFRRYRGWLLCIGIFCGYLAAAPSLIWVSGALWATAFVILAPLAIWIYTLVFAFSSLWFAHYCLAALQRLRVETLIAQSASTSPAPTLPDPKVVGLIDDTKTSSYALR
jgi:hypothetical protein